MRLPTQNLNVPRQTGEDLLNGLTQKLTGPHCLRPSFSARASAEPHSVGFSHSGIHHASNKTRRVVFGAEVPDALLSIRRGYAMGYCWDLTPNKKSNHL